MGSQDSKSTSAPVTAADRLKTYNAGMDAMGSGGGYGANYQAPQTERLNTDYSQLQNDLTAGYTAPLDRQKSVDLKASDQAMADRGIFTSRNAIQNNNDVNEIYAPQYAKAGADATNTRYQLQSQDIAGANANNLAIADKQYESSWRPADYRAGVWNGTGGVVSSGNTSGWSI